MLGALLCADFGRRGSSVPAPLALLRRPEAYGVKAGVGLFQIESGPGSWTPLTPLGRSFVPAGLGISSRLAPGVSPLAIFRRPKGYGAQAMPGLIKIPGHRTAARHCQLRRNKSAGSMDGMGCQPK